VLGSRYAKAPREECRDEEHRVAARIRNVPQNALMGGDEAAGVCIGYYGTRAGEVGKLLGKRAMAKALKAWGAQR
jgi:hypothetical protein